MKDTKDIHKGKFKIVLTFSILFLVVTLLLLLIFYEGKKTYVVQFDLNGGTLISGSLEQHVTQGQDAIPPSAPTMRPSAAKTEALPSSSAVTRAT